MARIDESGLKSLIGVGMLGLGALGGASDADARQNQPVPHQRTRRVSDETILTKTLPFTKKWEGFKDKTYYDTEDIPTIGYGCNLTQSHNKSKLEEMGYSINNLLSRNEYIKESDAESLLMFGMTQALKDAKSFITNWDQLDPIARLILIDMSFNLGRTRLSKFKNFKSALENLDYNKASMEMVDSKWYRQTKGRSKALVRMMDALADRT